MGSINGFIKLHRKLVEWGWYSNSVVKCVFLHILMVANYKNTQYMGRDLKPGQAIIGRKKMAAELGFSEQQIRTALNKLKSTGEITLESTNRYTIATIENWALYQCCDDDCNQQITNNQPTDNQQITNNQPHLKKDKNNKNNNAQARAGARVRHSDGVSFLEDVPEELREPLKEWVDMRKKIKKPVTSKETVKRALNKLDRLADTTEGKIAIINQSVDHCWQGFFELKEPEKPKEVKKYEF